MYIIKNLRFTDLPNPKQFDLLFGKRLGISAYKYNRDSIINHPINNESRFILKQNNEVAVITGILIYGNIAYSNYHMVNWSLDLNLNNILDILFSFVKIRKNDLELKSIDWVIDIPEDDYLFMSELLITYGFSNLGIVKNNLCSKLNWLRFTLNVR